MEIKELSWNDPIISDVYTMEEIEFLRGPKNHPVVLSVGKERVLRFATEPIVLMIHELYEVNLNQLWVIIHCSGSPAALPNLMEYYRDLGYSLSGFMDVFWHRAHQEDE